MAKMKTGLYHGRLIKAGVAELDNAKSTPYMYLTFDIDSRIEMGQEVFLDQNVERDVRFWLSDNALEYTEKDLDRMGFNGNYENPRFNETMYQDGVKLFCGENVQGEKSYEEWSIADLMRGKEKKAASKDLIKKLSAKWTAHGHTKTAFTETPATPKLETVPAGAAGVPGVPGVDNDDIPF